MRIGVLLGFVTAAAGFRGLLPAVGPHVDWMRRGSSFVVMQQGPGEPRTVRAPVGFAPPEPKPLTVTGDWLGMLTASVALACRVGAGITVVGWSPVLSLQPPDGYSLRLGPLYLSDTSLATRGECPRPAGRLILYEFDSSPYCRKVRDACAALDLELECRPCPGALPGGKYSDELYAKTGRRTVPYLIDEGMAVEMFGFSRARVCTRPIRFPAPVGRRWSQETDARDARMPHAQIPAQSPMTF
jgi:hypothetical protein